jgi:hypothetical protein
MRLSLVVTCAFFASLYCSSAQSTPSATSATPLRRIEREELCVTNGVVSALPDGRLAIDTPSSRAVLQVATAQTAEIRFRYLGPSERSKPLASGELRRQIGLKLRAQDTCNLLYAMWHIEPDSKIAVSVKSNAGKHTHEECGAGGYVNIKPLTSGAVRKIGPGESHTLRAELRGTNLVLAADGRIVWEGTVGNRITEFEGPVGFRTDNARFTFEYYAGGVIPGTQLNTLAHGVNRCRPSPGD